MKKQTAAFTLIELIVTILFASMAILALVMILEESLKNLERQKRIRAAGVLAEELLNEIRSKKYEDPQFPTNFGPEIWAGETNRLAYDDVDDYDGWIQSPPRTVEGLFLPGVTAFTWQTVVENVPENDFNAPAVPDKSTDFKRITTVISGPMVTLSNMTVKGKHD